jgi:hypothetical protein
MLPIQRECHHCGHTNDNSNFWEMHPEVREQFVAVWLDPDIARAIRTEAIDEGLTIPGWIAKAAEAHLTEIARRKYRVVKG